MRCNTHSSYRNTDIEHLILNTGSLYANEQLTGCSSCHLLAKAKTDNQTELTNSDYFSKNDANFYPR